MRFQLHWPLSVRGQVKKVYFLPSKGKRGNAQIWKEFENNWRAIFKYKLAEWLVKRKAKLVCKISSLTYILSLLDLNAQSRVRSHGIEMNVRSRWIEANLWWKDVWNKRSSVFLQTVSPSSWIALWSLMMRKVVMES